MSYQTLDARRDDGIERLTLQRPEVRNAFNDVMVAELTAWARATAADPGVRAVVIAGAGPTFCAGADLAWMAKSIEYTEAENLADARLTAAMFAAINALPVLVIGRVHGAALGGGAGLAAVCDLVISEEPAVFGFTEVKLGIIPAVISPFVLAKIGRSAARELFLTGRRFTAQHALDIGLVHAVVPPDRLDDAVGAACQEALAAGPQAVAAAKRLIEDAWTAESADDAQRLTAAALAERRGSAEGQEGLRAFLQKRKPDWSGV
ncbi:MAG TPA: enoyl-CoA hydratase-related protein [Vicinamibacterales bacterium]|nr:enoyl-CoA hydratase-related protein [Vicinamibacterales bacterium]